MHNDSVWEVSENTVIPKSLIASKKYLDIVFQFFSEMPISCCLTVTETALFVTLVSLYNN